MDNLKEYIESGILELYVYGALSDTENVEVYKVLKEHPEVREEVKEIEKSLRALSTAVAPSDTAPLYNNIKEKLNFNEEETPVTVSYTHLTLPTILLV